MSNSDYLKNVLVLQTLKSDGDEMKALEDRRKEVEMILRANFGKAPTIKLGGSNAKGTMIKEAYDLDVICYFGRDDNTAGDTLKDIYFNVRDLFRKDYYVSEKPSALRLKSLNPEHYKADFHIDVVPGRYVDNTSGDTFLYRSSGEKSRQKTNLDVHIEHVRNSGVRDAIRLMKLWRVRNGLHVRHFVLELLTIELLAGKKNSSLSSQLEHVWEQLRDNIDNISIQDPANPNGNDLSGIFDLTVRPNLSSVAASTLRVIEMSGWESVFGQIEELKVAEKAEILRQAATAVATPSKPWLPLQ